MTDEPMEDLTGVGRMYRKIKAEVIRGDYKQGEQIVARKPAGELKLSVPLVREALRMLVAEGLLIYTPNNGFSVIRLSEKRLTELYGWNQFLLNAVLTAHSLEAGVPADIAAMVETLKKKLGPEEHYCPKTIANHTGDLFSCIAKLIDNSHVVNSVDHVNDRLYYVRTLECQVLNDAPEELTGICRQFLARRFDDMAKAIVNYHDRRLASLDRLIDLLR